MEKRKPSRPLSPVEGYRMVESFFNSGESAYSFYSSRGISEWQFYVWKRRYLESHPEKESHSASSPGKQLHRIKICREVDQSPVVSPGIEIHYPDGVRVNIGKDSGIDFLLLSSLIKLRD